MLLWCFTGSSILPFYYASLLSITGRPFGSSSHMPVGGKEACACTCVYQQPTSPESIPGGTMQSSNSFGLFPPSLPSPSSLPSPFSPSSSSAPLSSSSSPLSSSSSSSSAPLSSSSSSSSAPLSSSSAPLSSSSAPLSSSS